MTSFDAAPVFRPPKVGSVKAVDVTVLFVASTVIVAVTYIVINGQFHAFSMPPLGAPPVTPTCAGERCEPAPKWSAQRRSRQCRRHTIVDTVLAEDTKR